ncbi:MAG: multidrug efflux SMR transporter [Selenomonadaceae bacterium]|nr:multidrug efflux SMR transporter [Selenomonadaceae bacterium]
MSWIYLFLAGLCEIGWTVGLKYTDGFSKLLPSVFVVLVSIGSLAFLSLAAQKLPLSIAYPIWTGMGVVGAFVFGAILFNEPVTILRVVFVSMIMCGIVGLRFAA